VSDLRAEIAAHEIEIRARCAEYAEDQARALDRQPALLIAEDRLFLLAMVDALRKVDAEISERLIERTVHTTSSDDWVIPHWAHAPIEDPADVRPCRSCGARIVWVTTRAGKRAPLNRDGTSHFSTCPQAEKWRIK
jgi:hypothetical protein